jgi:hypothetical protein
VLKPAPSVLFCPPESAAVLTPRCCVIESGARGRERQYQIWERWEYAPLTGSSESAGSASRWLALTCYRPPYLLQTESCNLEPEHDSECYPVLVIPAPSGLCITHMSRVTSGRWGCVQELPAIGDVVQTTQPGSPCQIVVTPGSPSCIRPRNPPRWAIHRTASLSVGGVADRIGVVWWIKERACHSCGSRAI